ncbi:hypothetical protein BDW59DRAFT_167173 [Aspergillus cavernicola]|uniref:chitinase n=1 Tax=Aspergillus cavernicola TaxID=176166 RepID=A0ABR4HGL0_9EURO
MKLSAVALTALSVSQASARHGNGGHSLLSRAALEILPKSWSTSSLHRRAECEYEIIEEDDTCESLAKKCGVKLSDFIKYNSGDSEDDEFCTKILPDDPICCSEGDLPDLRPQPDEDGYCHVHQVGDGDLCDTIETKFHLESTDLDDFNKGKTWGWAGCRRIQPGQKICVSKGKPPMPAEDKLAICGPQVSGTERPTNDTELADLNPCPLNVCCNIWGQCGTTKDFCIDTSMDDTPGTAKNGTNGCISNCGMDIVNNDDPPKEYSRIAYFEAWNHERECLHMDVTHIKSPYTHIHFAFGDISPDDFVPSGNGVEDQFKKFKEMKGDSTPKRIISFGGWAFSNEPGTNHIIRNGVKEENRQKFADNVIKFVEDNGLDGVDFDWEYPGAEDIPGSEPGGPEDGPNYLEFLKLVRDGLPEGKSLSIAAPASYWYLRGFPIKDIAKVVDYIVYMAYDLHGQWDVGNEFATEGCPSGNCLRSHVNMTETMNSLAMVTKAGVNANKIMVGVSSYGRSFKMSEKGCAGPDCKYEGKRNESPAKKGDCTDTGGYIADAEIFKIMELGEVDWKMTYDNDSDTNILVYDEVEWVGFMNSSVKGDRVDRYKKLNFAGVSDWAVDLQQDYSEEDGNIVYVDDDVYEGHEMDCSPPCTFVLPPSKLPEKTTISVAPYTTSVEIPGDTTTTTTITVTPKPITTDSVSFYNIPVTSGENASLVQPYPSLTLERPKIPITYVEDGETKTTTRTLILPPWPMITNGPPEDWDNSTWPPIITTDPGDEDPTSIAPPPTLTRVTLSGSLPEWTSFPGKIRPIKEKPDEPEVEDPDPDDPESDRRVKVPCDLWFFNLCVDELDIHGWEWIVPPGVIPPGPPPPQIINPPPGWTIGPVPPPWPRITIGGDGKPSPFPDKPEPCETEIASLCSATTSYGVTDDGTTTRTTTTSTGETCYTILGCNVEDEDETSTTEDVTCQPTYTVHNRRDVPATDVAALATATAVVDVYYGSTSDEDIEISALVKRQGQGWWFPPPDQNNERNWNNDAKALQGSCKKENVVVYCKDPYNCDKLADRLERVNKPGEGLLTVTKISLQGPDYKFTAFFWVDGLSTKLKANLLDMDECEFIYDPIIWAAELNAAEIPEVVARSEDEDGSASHEFVRRDEQVSTDWAKSRVSIPRDVEDWWKHEAFTEDEKAITDDSKSWKHHYHESAGKGQYVYVIDDCITYRDDQGRLPDFDGTSIVGIGKKAETYGPPLRNDCKHGTMVASLLAGKSFGIAPKVNLIPVNMGVPVRGSAYYDRQLEALVRVLDDLEKNNGRGGQSIVSMSWSIRKAHTAPQFEGVMLELFKRITKHGAILVFSAGNKGVYRLVDESYPGALAAHPDLSPNIIVVGSIDKDGGKSDFSQVFSGADQVGNIVYGPGRQVRGAAVARGGENPVEDGTSFATPLVSGLIAYWRSLPLNDLLADRIKRPTVVRGILNMFLRSLTAGGEDEIEVVKSIWSGQVADDNCLLNRNIELPNPDDENNPFRPCDRISRDIPLPSSITWGEGEPFPTCKENCGKLCEGYYCDPAPTGEPPAWAGPTSTTTSSASSTTTTSSTTTQEPEPTDEPDPPPPCIQIDIKVYQEYFSSESYATASVKVDGVEKCDSKVTEDFHDIEDLLQRAFVFDCSDGYELIGRDNAYWTEMDVFLTTPDIDNMNIDLNKEAEEDGVECDLDDDCTQAWWTNPGGCLEL